VVIMKDEKHLYGWYYGEMPDHWTTAVSPNGWTDGYLGLQWLERNFGPYTRPAEGRDAGGNMTVTSRHVMSRNVTVKQKL